MYMIGDVPSATARCRRGLRYPSSPTTAPRQRHPQRVRSAGGVVERPRFAPQSNDNLRIGQIPDSLRREGNGSPCSAAMNHRARRRVFIYMKLVNFSLPAKRNERHQVCRTGR